MDASKLRYFVSAVKHKSFAAAAQEHHMVASTLSRQIAALEEEMGAPLFYREAHSIELTPAGQRLFEAAPGYLRQFRMIHDNAQNLINQKETRLIVGNDPYAFALIPRMTDLYRTIHPEVEVGLAYRTDSYSPNTMTIPDTALYVTHRDAAEALPGRELASLGIHRWCAVTHRSSDFWTLSPEQKAVLRDQKVVRPSNPGDPVRIWMGQRVLRHRGHCHGTYFTAICAQALQHRVAILPEYLEPWLPRDLRMEQVFSVPLATESVLTFKRNQATPLEADFFEYIRDHYKP